MGVARDTPDDDQGSKLGVKRNALEDDEEVGQ